MSTANRSSYSPTSDPSLSLVQLLDPDVLANPYPLYHRLQESQPVHWDPYLHAWVVTRYLEVQYVLQHFSATCAPSPEQLRQMSAKDMLPIAEVMGRMMLFMNPPAHTRLRSQVTSAFTPARVEMLRPHIQNIVDELLAPLLRIGSMEVVSDFAEPLPTIVTAEMMGLPRSDFRQLKKWSADFAQVLGNWQHNSDDTSRILRTLREMDEYFRKAIADHRVRPRDAVIDALLAAECEGKHLTDDQVVANCILIMVGGQETTPSLISSGVLSLLRFAGELRRLKENPAIVVSAVEELLRFESPSQHTTRVATEDTTLAGQFISKGQSVIAVMGAANRDPQRFVDPDRLDLTRPDNHHLAFGAGGHYCFGAPLARIEGQVAFSAIARLRGLSLQTEPPIWRDNLGLRGLTTLPVSFDVAASVA